jgi:hypothetical protein
MPELLDVNHERELNPGDVLMVERKMRDKRTRKHWTWRFFMVVIVHDPMSDGVNGYIVGNERLKGKAYNLHIDQERNTVSYLSPDEWPDGVHVLRMQMVLAGQIEGIV